MIVASLIDMLLAQSVPDDSLPGKIASWSFVGGMATVMGWFLRRWSKQRDDAFAAAQETEERVSARYEAIMSRERDERRAVEAVLVANQQSMRRALFRVVDALSRGELDRETRNKLRSDVLEVLSDNGPSDRGDGPASPAAPDR